MAEEFDIKVSDCGGDYIIQAQHYPVGNQGPTDAAQSDGMTSKPAVNLLEDKMPPEENEEWAVQMDSYEETKYERLKQFRPTRRMVAERLKAIGTQKTSTKKDGAGVCVKDRCLRKGHKYEKCPAKKDR